MIQIFGTKKCKETKKAERFFKERRIKFQFIDLNIKGLSKGELTKVAASVGLENLLNKNSKIYINRGLKFQNKDTFNLLLQEPLLFKTPITRNSNKSTIGVKPEIWKEWI